MGILRTVVTFLFMIFALAANANADENRYCSHDGSGGTSPTTRIVTWRAGSVTPGAPATLRVAVDSNEPSCNDGSCVARGGAAGVEVRRAGSSVCVGVPGRGKLTTMFGWIPASRWHPTDSTPQPAVRWTGVWQNETAKITVRSVDDGQLDIRGHAIRDLNADNEIFGDFVMVGKPERGAVTTKDDSDSCKVSVRLVGDYLVAADNGACGGMGVSFAGMYRLRHR
jgi:hypothetical protein